MLPKLAGCAHGGVRQLLAFYARRRAGLRTVDVPYREATVEARTSRPDKATGICGGRHA